MPTIVIQHPVKDYAAWRAQFDADPLGRVKSGVTGHAIYRTGDGVLVLLEFGSATDAEAYLPRLRMLWGSVSSQLGLGQAPDAKIVEPVESVAY
jgi:hypothetical protein